MHEPIISLVEVCKHVVIAPLLTAEKTNDQRRARVLLILFDETLRLAIGASSIQKSKYGIVPLSGRNTVIFSTDLFPKLCLC